MRKFLTEKLSRGESLVVSSKFTLTVKKTNKNHSSYIILLYFGEKKTEENS